jgi:uncharacterized membrane protein YbhN (UPF0104 family)
VRIAGALLVVGATVAVVGAEPFVEGLSALTPVTMLAAVVLAAVATVAAAWRWRIVSAGFGLPLSWGEAISSYYRSQFLNSVLPGGVAGDVHRAYAHGRPHERVGLAARAVFSERVFGQLVQILVTLAVLLPFGLASSLAPLAWLSAVVGIVAVAGIGALALAPRGRSLLRRELGMLRPLVSRPARLLAVVLASAVVVAAHVATFVLAGLAVGVHVDPRVLAAVALLALAAAAIPLSVGGWGAREAVSASAFALAGLSAGAGVAASTAFGVLALVAVTPGAVVMLAGRFRSLHARGMIGRRRSA